MKALDMMTLDPVWTTQKLQRLSFLKYQRFPEVRPQTEVGFYGDQL
uniref:Uncharacterized protein n=1 Tax=uncultured marine bacterium Ant24C4 TaxID=360425 RepID=Q2PYC6_9BACT|nr:hypothetical protein [uncultured marine bacterium Ant24C4]